jgi:hypothetical protein
MKAICIIIFMLVCGVVWAAGCEHEFEQYGDNYKCVICKKWYAEESVRHYKDHKTLLRLEDKIDKIFSMVCDGRKGKL